MTIDDCIRAAYKCRIEDAGTRAALRDEVLPRLESEAEELRTLRLYMHRKGHAAEWRQDGFYHDEARTRKAIQVARFRLRTVPLTIRA